MAYTVLEPLASLDSHVMPGERKVFVALRDDLDASHVLGDELCISAARASWVLDELARARTA